MQWRGLAFGAWFALGGRDYFVCHVVLPALPLAEGASYASARQPQNHIPTASSVRPPVAAVRVLILGAEPSQPLRRAVCHGGALDTPWKCLSDAMAMQMAAATNSCVLVLGSSQAAVSRHLPQNLPRLKEARRQMHLCTLQGRLLPSRYECVGETVL